MKGEKELLGTLRGFDDFFSNNQTYIHFISLQSMTLFLSLSDMVLDDVRE